MKILTILVFLASILTAAADTAEQNRNLLIRSKQILFLGDSITSHGGYVTNFEIWLHAYFPKRQFNVINLGLPSETVSGLSEQGHAEGQFPRPNLHTRLDNALKQVKPDLVFACYGMNCGIYQPFRRDHFKKYQDGIIQLKTKVEATGAKIIFITPPYYDSLKKPDTSFYTDVLAKYSAWLVSQQKHGWNVIDLNTQMTKEILKLRKTNPHFTVQPDSIHPDSAGHWLMTRPIIAWFGDQETAACNSIQEVLALHKLPASIATLTAKRQQIMQHPWLAKVGHSRPGVPTGLPFNEATMQAKSITREIKNLYKLAGQ